MNRNQILDEEIDKFSVGSCRKLSPDRRLSPGRRPSFEKYPKFEKVKKPKMIWTIEKGGLSDNGLLTVPIVHPTFEYVTLIKTNRKYHYSRKGGGRNPGKRDKMDDFQHVYNDDEDQMDCGEEMMRSNEAYHEQNEDIMFFQKMHEARLSEIDNIHG